MFASIIKTKDCKDLSSIPSSSFDAGKAPRRTKEASMATLVSHQVHCQVYLQDFKLTFRINFGHLQLDITYAGNHVSSGGTEQTFKT